MIAVGLVSLGFCAGGTVFTLLLLGGRRAAPGPRRESHPSHVCITPRAFDWQRIEPS